MAGDEVGLIDQIGGADRIVAKTKVGFCNRSSLLGVVNEICLYIFVRLLADNLNCRLVGTYCTVSAQSIEDGLIGIILLC